jgi:hypothetical protein
LAGKRRRKLSNRGAVSAVISAVLLTAAALALGLVVLHWTYQRSFVANEEYVDTIESNLDKIREKLVFAHIFYNSSGNELTVYLLNCGKSNETSIAEVYLFDNSSEIVYKTEGSEVDLRHLNDDLTQGLNVGEEGYVRLSVSLVADMGYSVYVVTERGRSFAKTFVA